MEEGKGIDATHLLSGWLLNAAMQGLDLRKQMRRFTYLNGINKS